MKMKIKYRFFTIAAAALLTLGVTTSCSDDEFDPSIFDTEEHWLDKTSVTFPLDTFCIESFREPYNLRYVYKMEDIGSDMQKNLVPASYDKSKQLAVLAKYLWYESYEVCAGQEFLKLYSPRIIHVIGSKSYNPVSGTETLGEAEGGLKITLYGANELDVNNIDKLNENFFKTMHHEFGHILAQNYTYPTSFSLISQGLYNAVNWQDTQDSIALAEGFVSPYAQSQIREDWVEVLANYIVKDTITWTNMLNTASFDWEETEIDASYYERCVALGANRDSVGYYVSDGTKSSTGSVTGYNVVRKVISRDANGNPLLDENGKMIYLEQDGVNGKEVILQKLDLVRTWLKDNFNVDLDQLRREVQNREWVTDADGNFVIENGHLVNKLTAPTEENPSKTLMEVLLDEVNKFEALQQ